MSAPLPTETSTSASRYVCLRRIAEGGMAEVLLARREGAAGFRKLVAIKRVLPRFANDPVLVEMFLQEARLAATLEHSNLAQVMDFGILGGRYFLAMEYVDGRDLRTVLRHAGQSLPDQRLSLSHALHIVQSVAAGLHYAHERRDADGHPLGIVHRDISPSNVLVSFDGEVKLGDFGIAKATERPEPGTATANLRGKLAYMSPEQARSEPLDRRSDIFALGILLFEATTGFRQFQAETQYELMNRVAEGRVIAPREIDPDYPEALEAIVMRALAFDRDDRYATAIELHDALGTFAVQQGLRTDVAPQLGALMRTLFPATEPVREDTAELATIALGRPERPDMPPSTHPAAAPTGEPRGSMRHWPLVVGGLGVVVALGVARPWASEPASPASPVVDVSAPPPPQPVAEPPAESVPEPPSEAEPEPESESESEPAAAVDDARKRPARRTKKKRVRDENDPAPRGGRLEDWALPPK